MSQFWWVLIKRNQPHKTSKRALLLWLEPLLPQVEAELARGEKLVEVR